MAAETSGEAIIPVNLALLKLNLMNMIRQYDSVSAELISCQ